MRRILASLLITVAAGCGGDRIVSLDAGSGSKRIQAHVDDRVDIHLWAGAAGVWATTPTISTPVVAFIDASDDIGGGDFVSPGGPGQLFRFRAVAQGIALVTFRPMQQAPVVIDTIDVE